MRKPRFRSKQRKRTVTQLSTSRQQRYAHADLLSFQGCLLHSLSNESHYERELGYRFNRFQFSNSSVLEDLTTLRTGHQLLIPPITIIPASKHLLPSLAQIKIISVSQKAFPLPITITPVARTITTKPQHPNFKSTGPRFSTAIGPCSCLNCCLSCCLPRCLMCRHIESHVAWRWKLGALGLGTMLERMSVAASQSKLEGK